MPRYKTSSQHISIRGLPRNFVGDLGLQDVETFLFGNVFRQSKLIVGLPLTQLMQDGGC